MSGLPFCEIYRINDVNEKIGFFNQLFTNTLDKHAPIKRIRIKGRTNKFINNELKSMMKLRDKSLKVFRLTRKGEDWNVYKQLRNSIKSSLRTAESNYAQKQIDTYKGDPRYMWKVIREFVPSKDSEKPVYQKDHKILANEFNEYFASVGKATADKVKKLAEENNIQITTTLPPVMHRSSHDIFEFRTVTSSEVRNIIVDSPSNKAPGDDKINIQFIKDSLEVSLDPITDIINCSLMTSTYPKVWKMAEVIPLYKEGDPEVAQNNRPISLLSCLSKICDKVVLNQYTEYLTKHKLMTRHQSGNQKNHSTETLNIATTDLLLEAMDNKQLSIVIFLDMSKAFDSVRQDMLLQRISNLGASPAVYTWFKSYLSDRWQYVRIGTTASAPATLSYGIPQGSVLSPFLFNIYTDSLPSVPESCNLESYVDDSKTFLSFTLSNMNHSLRQVEEDLHRVFEWCCRNSLLVNPEKTKMLLVGTRQLMNQLETPIHINFMGETLTPVTEVKDLGMFLDSHLTYDKHIQVL